MAINSAPSESVPVGLAGFSRLNSLARNSDGMIFSVGGDAANQLITINLATGVATVVKTLDFGPDRHLDVSDGYSG